MNLVQIDCDHPGLRNPSQRTLAPGGEEGNPRALAEMREYLQLKASHSRVMLDEVVNRFVGIPWGWKPEWEIVLLVARLFMAGEIKLVMDSADLDPRAAIEPLTKSARFKQVSILKRKVADAESLKKARKLHQDLFSSLPPEEEDGLVAVTRDKLAAWQTELKGYAPLAATKHHPGKAIIDTTLVRIGKQLAVADSFEFIESFIKDRDEWLDLSDNAHDVTSFYKTQRPTWQRLLEALARFADNRDLLDKEVSACVALQNLEGIRDDPAPWGHINKIEPFIASVEKLNDALVAERRAHALLSIDNKIAEVSAALDAIQADATLRNQALAPLQKLKTLVAGLGSIPQIYAKQGAAGEALDTAMYLIDQNKPKPTPGVGDGATNPPPVVQPKKPKVINAAALQTKTYFETEAEVDAYLDRLKAELLKIIQAGQRARLQ